MQQQINILKNNLSSHILKKNDYNANDFTVNIMLYLIIFIYIIYELNTKIFL